ncbi:MAG TPA: Rne/Rng family ribonuclease [Nitrospirota bacterium]|nr:Rne/Rng family ribonuclease [Nitrospirota bacterium]
MSTEIIINAASEETRVAVLENKEVVELYIDRRRESGIAGNTYKGKVVKILPGIQSAFVDIGIEKAAFLYVSDAGADAEEYARMIEEEGLEGRTEFKTQHSIEDILQEGQEIMVQVSKEPIGTKGARITSYLSLPGRYLVLMPTVEHIGISRRIKDGKERARLKEIVQSIRKPGMGYIIRTASEEVDQESLTADAEFLELLWENIQRKKEGVSAPALLYSELDLTFRTVRDLFTSKVDRLVIDSRSEYERIREFVRLYLPGMLPRLELHEGEEPIFEAYDIEAEINRALDKKVWLKSGGYIVIDHAEALTVIDVNTGKYVGKRDPEETITQTNLEAVKEVAYQLRLRNIGGIIIIDFIDMEKEKNREKVFNAMQEAFAKDRARTNIIRMSELGLIEMSRKRTKENLMRTLCEPCNYCGGRGYTKSVTTISYELFRKIRKLSRITKDKKILVTVHPTVANFIFDEERQIIDELEKEYQKRIVIKGDPGIHVEEYDILTL